VTKRKLLVSILTLVLVSFLTPSKAFAEAKIHVSFAMINPLTKSSVGAGVQIMLRQVNGRDSQQSNTNSDGVASFDIAPLPYILDSCCAGGQSGVEYLITPQIDGSVSVNSAADVLVKKDSHGNWIIASAFTRKSVTSDPWQRANFKNQLDSGIEHLFLLTNGKVLAAISAPRNKTTWSILTPDVNGNYGAGSWAKIRSPAPNYNPKVMNGAILHSGRVLIFAGEHNWNSKGVYESNINQSFIYDVSANTWSEVTPPNNGQGEWLKIGATPFTELADGRVMVGALGDRSPDCYNKSMLFDETDMSWTLTGSNKSGCNIEAGYTLLSNDKVLTLDTDWGTKNTDLFDPATGKWSLIGDTALALSHSEIGPALTLPTGKVLAEGTTGANALYDPVTNSWSSVPSFPLLKNGIQLGVPDNFSAILPSGNILTSTGTFICSTENCAPMGPSRYFEYDWKTNNWVPVIDDLISPSTTGPGNGIKMLPLPTGQVMVAKGKEVAFYSGRGSADTSWLPIVDSISSSTLNPKSTYHVSGKQLSGLTQGVQFGDEYENATNYPLVRIVNNSSHHVFYATTSKFSTTSITPMVPSTFDFTIGSNFESGPSKMYVVSNGIASAPVDVTISGADRNVAASKKTTITCVQGKNTKSVTSLKPVCPSGYKKK